jgi:hypothetical protein
VWQHYQHPCKGLLLCDYNIITSFRNKGESSMTEEPSHVQKVSLSHIYEIMLNGVGKLLGNEQITLTPLANVPIGWVL